MNQSPKAAEQTRALYAAMAKLAIAQQRYDAREITAEELQAAEDAFRKIKAEMTAAIEEG